MKTVLLLICLLVGFVNTFSQEKVILKSDFDQITKTASQIFKSNPFRRIRTTEIVINGKPQSNTFSKTVLEVAGDNRRVISERHFINAPTSKETTKNEYVQIGEKAYSRENDGKWKETPAVDKNRFENNLKVTDEQSEYKSLGTENFNNQSTNVFVKNSTTKRIDESNENKEIITVESVKYWFGADGRLFKREAKRENRTGELVFNIHIISLYEYDPSIQISFPK